MLTIDEIKEVKFRTGRGSSYYRAEDVDAFIDEVVETFEQMNGEKAELVHKMDILATRIEQYRSDEETVRNALLSAQKVADTTLKEANEKSEVIIKNAEEQSKQIQVNIQNEIAKEKEDLSALHNLAAEMRAEIFAKMKDCIDLVSALPAEKNVAELKARLDKEFPTPKATDLKAVVAQPAEPFAVKSEEEKPAEPVKIEAPVAVEASEDDLSAAVGEHTRKFGVLKFGSNYDVDE
ncbi:MAG: DivIVA domain-containing protein [Ruminococcus sp.]|nr:DivIVA domain-containing protein [Ruminococcus sp.]